VNQPSVEDTISILRGLKKRYEVHHGVRIKDAALVAAAILSNRYIADRFLPDQGHRFWSTRPPPSCVRKSTPCPRNWMKPCAA